MVGEPSFTMSPPHVDDGAAGDRALQNVVEDPGQVIKTDVRAHCVQGHGLEVRPEPLPDGASGLDRVLDRVDPDEGHGTQDERHDGGGETYATGHAAGRD